MRHSQIFSGCLTHPQYLAPGVWTTKPPGFPCFPLRLSWVQDLPMRSISPGLNQAAKGLTEAIKVGRCFIWCCIKVDNVGYNIHGALRLHLPSHLFIFPIFSFFSESTIERGNRVYLTISWLIVYFFIFKRLKYILFNIRGPIENYIYNILLKRKKKLGWSKMARGKNLNV